MKHRETKQKKVRKENLSDWYHWILEEADIVDSRYSIKGMLVYKKWGLLIIREMQRYLESLLEESGHEPTLFPVLIPEDILGKETQHIAGFEEQVFWVTHAGENKLERKLALRPTSETSIYEMFRLWIRSHTDLPLKVHQSCAVYRYETKHTRPLIRGREFLWNEGHAAHADKEDAKKNILEIQDIYGKLIRELLCMPFLIDRRPDWDRFPGADDTYAFDTIMPDGKTLQIATVHDLGQNFSTVFDITYEDSEGKHQHIYQTSYGPSFGRLLAALISIHGDDRGLVLPPKIAPLQVIIIPIIFKESDTAEIMEYAKKIRKKLDSMDVRTEIDAGEERPGAKFYYWEMKGVPLRLEVGPKDLKEKKITVVRRDTGDKSTIAFDEVDDVCKIFEDMSKDLGEKAEKGFNGKMFEAPALEDVGKYAGKGVIKIGWCGRKACAEEIGGYVSILNVDGDPLECVVCGDKGQGVRAAKTY
ncbi:MAG: proline--tRNA ligase [Candidatus Altiarchaeota archaeon]|nr:proline--tRNA ligase [Candidatus Altiarchaeota archaeon]